MVSQQLPDELHRLFELDADFAEALHVMDIDLRGIDVRAMLRDTEASFAEVSDARAEFLDTLDAPIRKRIETRVAVVRATLDTDDAYLDIPGRNPAAG